MLLCCAVLAVCALPAWAEETVTSSETVIHLTVQPAAAPRPALRILLLPDLKEMNPGNPIQNYLKCFAEQTNFFFKQEAFERREKLLTMPLKQMPAHELEDYGGSALRQADWAARLDQPDWQILLKLKTEGVGLLLPDVQQMRALANALKVRFRAEVALGRLDAANRTAKTMFSLARHMGQHPTLIGDLVGIAIAYVTIGPLEEMLEQPGCPNLYWALTNLPQPFISLEKGMQGERTLTGSEFRDLDDKSPMTPEQLHKVIAHLDKIFEDIDGKPIKPGRVTAWLDAHVKNEATVNAARRRLVEYGLAEERVKQFPAEQVLLLDEKREYEVQRDETMKLANLPAWQADAIQPHLTKPKEWSIWFELVPALDKVRRAQARLDQRIALLRHVEALRLYAAAHDGKLPEKLTDIAVPLPVDPFTGKPFRYKLEGTTAHLRGTPPSGLEKQPPWNIHYEVTIQK
jgi:hypothetical protein